MIRTLVKYVLVSVISIVGFYLISTIDEYEASHSSGKFWKWIADVIRTSINLRQWIADLIHTSVQLCAFTLGTVLATSLVWYYFWTHQPTTQQEVQEKRYKMHCVKLNE